jgi:hypothetical protein
MRLIVTTLRSFVSMIYNSSMSVTAVLLTYQRLSNLNHIIENIRSVPRITEILLWCNGNANSTIIRDVTSTGIKCLSSGRNEFIYGRFLAAEQATNDTIYTQDDDVLVSDIDTLIDLHASTDRLTCYLDEGHMRCVGQKYRHCVGKHVLNDTQLGWGSVFAKSSISVLDRYRTRFGTDTFFLRKSDRLFCLLQCQEHICVQTKLHHLAGATDETALYRMKDHWRLNDLAAQRAMELVDEH